MKHSFFYSFLSSLTMGLAYVPVYMAAEAKELVSTIVRYYPNPRFRRADLRCLWAYLMLNPASICTRYLRNFPDDEVQKIYGETSFSTLEKIAVAVDLKESDVIYDLGCGRGRSVFWFNAMYGCRAVGIDINPVFIAKARKIQKKTRIEGVDFILGNVMDVDFQDATLIYLYGTAFTNKAIVKLLERFKTLKPNTRVISVSFPLNAYSTDPLFEEEQSIPVRFVWGSTRVYIQRRV